jgi:hypothetical protein
MICQGHKLNVRASVTFQLLFQHDGGQRGDIAFDDEVESGSDRHTELTSSEPIEVNASATASCDGGWFSGSARTRSGDFFFCNIVK